LQSAHRLISPVSTRPHWPQSPAAR